MRIRECSLDVSLAQTELIRFPRGVFVLCAYVLSHHVWKKSHKSCTLHRCRKLTLILGGNARAITIDDTTMGIDELLQDLRIFVVDVLNILLTEITLLFHIGNFI